MKNLAILFVTLLFMTSCEEVIDVDLNTADPRYVIEAELLGGSESQRIRVTQTVAFDSEVPNTPIDHAAVSVQSSDGRLFNFSSIGNGYYANNRFSPRESLSYRLSVQIDGEEFTSTERMREFVPVDSVGVIEETIFNEINYSVLFKFKDPAEEDNYYKYTVSVNERPFRFLQIQSDKYNNGLYVTHQLMDYLNPFELGDTLVIRRQSVSPSVYRYWNEIQLMNPGSAAPANPTSNISNGALGYFSISPFKDYGMRIRPISESSDLNE